jgi:hypothetical protein
MLHILYILSDIIKLLKSDMIVSEEDVTRLERWKMFFFYSLAEDLKETVHLGDLMWVEWWYWNEYWINIVWNLHVAHDSAPQK